MTTAESVRPGAQGLRVAIVGGGIGGRCALMALRRAGLANVSLYEQASTVVDSGAGIQVSPNAVRLLTRLGLADQLRAAGVRLETGWELRRWQDGQVLSSQRLGSECERTFGAPYYVLHRTDLLTMLGAGTPDPMVHLGYRCVAVTETADDVRLTFDNGLVVLADVVIGADGVRSVVQHALGVPPAPVFSGLAAYRCLIPADRAPAMAGRPVFTSWLGPGRHLVHYPVSAGRLINVAAAVPAVDWHGESWTAQGQVADLVAEFAGWDERLAALISAADTVWVYALHDREPLEHWVTDRVAVLGDAAHPMLPAMAQGAAQAIEDAVVLARCLRDASTRTVAAALSNYQDIRWERATRIQQLSRRRPKRNHLPDGAEQRKRDQEFVHRDRWNEQAWIYGHDAEDPALSTAFPART